MNIDTLNNIANKAFKSIEADVIIVFYNEQKGVQIIPFWEHSCEFKTAEEMHDSVETTLIYDLIKFADENSGESIGTFAMEYDEAIGKE